MVHFPITGLLSTVSLDSAVLCLAPAPECQRRGDSTRFPWRQTHRWGRGPGFDQDKVF